MKVTEKVHIVRILSRTMTKFMFKEITFFLLFSPSILIYMIFRIGCSYIEQMMRTRWIDRI